ncbi:MAG: Fic family protein [Candidatus Cardinium sp.]|uniref:Fic family protein n=1 Tax=Cardinium endosymbiont of Dermatophagoides farinae TaxID=2597823 RepID=UPI001182DFF4|nr:Fic family protein [Cardinium endosymbiont of Dermatophagoides farinae]TSJ81046.1 Fic family protein [Cardinium endosymbiont of Dermatophagoides farinae]UWW97076.1 MAG: Fic family protein [Candidatus Cardinium sp.]
MRTIGIYQSLGGIDYFMPYALPPKDPPFAFDVDIMALYGEASFSLGQLNEMSQRLPDINRFIKAYVIKEALLSSSIEGIHTTFIDVLTHPLSLSKPAKNVQLVLNYTKALDQALTMLTAEGFPLASRVILAAHALLLSNGEGDKAAPGCYRKQAVQVGNLIPPMASEVPHLMAALEQYIHEADGLPVLIKAGLVHVQFEMIHPFLDGNGRIGRLLIVLMLIESGLLRVPILYPSYFFKKYHFDYYQKLDRVRTAGDFEGWIAFYLKAIRDSARDGYTRAKEIECLEISLKNIIQQDNSLLKTREIATIVLNFLFIQPITTIVEVSQATGKAYNTISNIFKPFVALGILAEQTLYKRNKVYRFQPYLALLEKEYA